MDKLSKSFLALSAIGIAVSIYHAYGEITAYSAPGSAVCDLNSFLNCGDVFHSGYTTFLGLSLWVYGVVWFPLMLLLCYLFVRRTGSIRGEIMVPVLMIGDVFTIYLWYLELVKIHALCPVCVSLYVLNYIMTGLCVYDALRE